MVSLEDCCWRHFYSVYLINVLKVGNEKPVKKGLGDIVMAM